MKHKPAALTALLLSALFPAALSSAADAETYEPTLYFRTEAAENVTSLPTGRLYLNRNKFPDGAKITAGAYYLDEPKATNMLYAKWQCDSDSVRLTNLTDPITAAGACPYSKWTSPSAINLKFIEEDNYMAVSYPSTVSSPLAVTGESTDSYPLACFDIELPADIPSGRYEVYFRQGDMGDISSASYANPIRDIRPSGDHAPSLFIGVSDRDLGDVNNSGKLEATDASKVLVAYTFLSSGDPSGLTIEEELAAEVNGDGLITASDASQILIMYADSSN